MNSPLKIRSRAEFLPLKTCLFHRGTPLILSRPTKASSPPKPGRPRPGLPLAHGCAAPARAARGCARLRGGARSRIPPLAPAGGPTGREREIWRGKI